jgi:cyclic dehypoxanthinyl futalosine synthase
VIYDASLDELLQKVWDGRRINQAEALRLYHLPLEELGALADRRRQIARADGLRWTRQRNRHLHRRSEYQLHERLQRVLQVLRVLSHRERMPTRMSSRRKRLDKKIEETVALGGTQILLQGGHHPKLTKQWYLDLLAHMKGKFPQVNVHGFSPSEFVHFREVFNEPLEKIISDFKAAGLGSIPGRRRRDPGGPGAPAGFAAQSDER